MLYKKKEVSFDHNCILRTDFLKLSLFFFRSGVKSCVNPVTDTTETTKESHQNSSKNEASEATGCSVGTTWIDPAQTYWLWKKMIQTSTAWVICAFLEATTLGRTEIRIDLILLLFFSNLSKCLWKFGSGLVPTSWTEIYAKKKKDHEDHESTLWRLELN